MIEAKILIVDDIDINRMLLRKMLLKMSNYTVIEASDGKQAITLFEKENPDLILMDINMPEMDGLQSAAIIKEASAGNYIPIIYVTALSAESSLVDALAAGGDDFISKPFDLNILKSKMKVHLRIRELNKQLTTKNNQLSNMNQQLSHEQELIEYFFESALKQSYLDKKFINYHMSSMSAFNGDIFLASRSPQGDLCIVMGDFAGHGLTAAMGTLPVAMIFFDMVAANASIADIARELNRQLEKLLPTSMFFAATLLELNSQGNMLTAWMGGMPECYWISEKGELKGMIESQHMPLGILHDNGFDAKTEIFSVADNDKFYLYSDGIIEACRPNGDMFGSERLKNSLISNDGDRIEKVLEELNVFTDAIAQNDDITLVELSCHAVLVNDDIEEVIDNDNANLAWEMSISLSADDLRNKEPILQIAAIVGSLPVLQRHKDVIEVLLSEIYFNALDYSILCLDGIEKGTDAQFEAYYALRAQRLKDLDDAFIHFHFHYCSEPDAQRLLIRMEDSGKGYHGHMDNESEDRLHGRGLEIIESLCESVTFSEHGKTLELLYKF